MRERQVIRTADLPSDILEQIAKARMDSKYDFLDELMDETDAEPKP